MKTTLRSNRWSHLLKRVSPLVAVLALSGAAVACSSTPDAHTVGGKNGNALPPEVKVHYDEGIASVQELDRTNGWTPETCDKTAKMFLDAADKSKDFLATAVYNAGVAYQRCNDRVNASKYYKQVLDKDPKFHRARVQLALFAFADSNETAIDPAITELDQAVHDSEYQNTEALVNLSRLQMKRGGKTKDAKGNDDFENAKLNLQRALAVDDAYMPAFNQLAIYYLESAKRQAGKTNSKFEKAGSKSSKVDTQALDLALLVTSQAIRKNAGFAPTFNTAGLIFVQQGNLNKAVESFGTARKLDPTFFEAHMNYAAVNMQFRGFAQAEQAYRDALKIRPTDYDAHLGLALALRGEINDTNFDAKLKEAEGEIDAAKKIDDKRPEAYFNHAILVQEFKAKSGDSKSNDSLQQAITLYQAFVDRAKDKPDFAPAVDDVNTVASKPDQQCLGAKAKEDHACKKGRIQNIKEIIAFNNESEAARKKAAEEAKQQQALDEAGAAAPADSGGAVPAPAPNP